MSTPLRYLAALFLITLPARSTQLTSVPSGEAYFLLSYRSPRVRLEIYAGVGIPLGTLREVMEKSSPTNGNPLSPEWRIGRVGSKYYSIRGDALLEKQQNRSLAELAYDPEDMSFAWLKLDMIQTGACFRSVYDLVVRCVDKKCSVYRLEKVEMGEYYQVVANLFPLFSHKAPTAGSSELPAPFGEKAYLALPPKGEEYYGLRYFSALKPRARSRFDRHFHR